MTDTATNDTTTSTLAVRTWRALGPVAGGLILDFADLATLGPLGLYAGLPVGALIGWWLAGFHDLERPARLGLALLAGVYCALPFTNFLPVATVLGAVGRFFESGEENPSAEEPAPDAPLQITGKRDQAAPRS